MAKKRDINLLESLNQSTKKKSSSSMTAIMAFGIVVLVGVIVFLFASAKVNISKNQDVIDDLDKQLGKENEVVQLEQQYAQAQQEYSNKIIDVISIVYPNKTAVEKEKISSMFFNLIFDYVQNNDDLEGNDTLKISSIIIDTSSITLSCGTNEYDYAWHFTRFLAGELDTDESKKNLLYFSNVEANYPGLPSDSGDGEYSINFTLKFNVNWGAFV